jgi:hypothetical protein
MHQFNVGLARPCADVEHATEFFMKTIGTPLVKGLRNASLTAIACLALTFPLSAANAGFFDFLFSPLQPAAPAQPSYQYPPQSGYPGKKKRAAHRPKNLVAKIHPGRQGHDVIGLMDDESLKNGDVVMTPAGIRIFTGSSGPHHSEDDFAKISEMKGLSKTQRSALLFLDSGAANAGIEPGILAGRSVADGGPTAGEMIKDPKGNKVRYVGP